jgi:hypothetical protein
MEARNLHGSRSRVDLVHGQPIAQLRNGATGCVARRSSSTNDEQSGAAALYQARKGRLAHAERTTKIRRGSALDERELREEPPLELELIDLRRHAE